MMRRVIGYSAGIATGIWLVMLGLPPHALAIFGFGSLVVIHAAEFIRSKRTLR